MLLYSSYLRDYVIPNESASPDLFVFLTYKGGASGVVGIAWVGTVCYSDFYKGYRVGINEWFGSDLRFSEVK